MYVEMIYSSMFYQVMKRDFLSWQRFARVVWSRFPWVSLKERLTPPLEHKGTLIADAVNKIVSISAGTMLFISLK